MLIIPLKCSPRNDLREPLARWLDGNSSSTGASAAANPLDLISLRPDFKSHDCRQELIRLASLRNCLSDSIMKPTSHKVALEEMALQDCHEYHAALYEFIRRGFPTNDENGSSLALTWKASVGPQQETHANLEWDRACTIWNIAALESYLASIQASDKQGRKQAVKHCSIAACMLRYLHDNIIPQQQFATFDFSLPSLLFWESYMLAQAQCATFAAYQLAQEDGATPNQAVLSYLAMGAVPLWNEALQQSKSTLLASQLPVLTQEWSIVCKSWSMWFQAIAAHHQALAAQQAQSWGLELAWLQDSLQQFQACHAFVQSSGDLNSLQHEIDSKVQIVESRLLQAKRDNTTIYGEKIPTRLPTIVPKQLVKSEMADLPESMTKPKVPLFS